VIGAEPVARTEVIKKLWDYIKANGLQDAANKRAINADAKLLPGVRQAAGDDVRAGRHRRQAPEVALAVTSATRSSQLPEVPTVRESGVAGTANFEAVGWLGLMAPRGTPPEIVERLNHEVTDILKSEQMARFIRERGSEPSPTTPAEFDRFVASEIGVWGAAVKASGAKPE
jgi:hypothetical protein